MSKSREPRFPHSLKPYFEAPNLSSRAEVYVLRAQEAIDNQERNARTHDSDAAHCRSRGDATGAERAETSAVRAREQIEADLKPMLAGAQEQAAEARAMARGQASAIEQLIAGSGSNASIADMEAALDRVRCELDSRYVMHKQRPGAVLEAIVSTTKAPIDARDATWFRFRLASDGESAILESAVAVVADPATNRPHRISLTAEGKASWLATQGYSFDQAAPRETTNSLRLAVKPKNAVRIRDVLSHVNGKARTHSYGRYADIEAILSKAIGHLNSKRVTHEQRAGSTITKTSGAPARRYRGMRIATSVLIRFGKGGRTAYLEGVSRESVGTDGGGQIRIGLTTSGQVSWLSDCAEIINDAPAPIRTAEQAKEAAEAAEKAIFEAYVIGVNAKAWAKEQALRAAEEAELAAQENLCADDLDAISQFFFDEYQTRQTNEAM
jgi:hypothetical protein